MRTHRAGLSILALSLAAVVGCSSGKGGPPEAPPTAPEPPKAQPKPAPPPEAEPEPEPLPGEPARLSLPKDNGAWPWAVGTADEPGVAIPVTFKGLAPYAVTGFAVRPELNRAVVSIKHDPSKVEAGKKGPPPKGPTNIVTRVVSCDTSTGRTLTEWHLPGQYAVLDLAPDGRSILATAAQPGGRNVLRVWVAGTDSQLKRFNWIPHTAPRDGLRSDTGRAETPGATDVRWAAFAGADRVVSASRGGQLRVFETEGLKPLATIDASPCRPALSPDGTKVAFLVGSAVALLDTTTLKVVGTRWVGPPPPQPALAFSPDGRTLAVGGNGRVVLLDLTTGNLQSVPLPKLDVNDNGVYDKPFGWAGSGLLLAENLLHDPQLPAPVWEYSGAEAVQFRGGRVWALVRSPAVVGTVALRALPLPAPDVTARLAAAKAKADAFALKPGDKVKIDAAGLPEDRRAEAQAMLERRVREAGYVPDPAAAATLVASVDSPGTRPTVIYSGLGSYPYTRKPARLKLVLNGKELWGDAWAVEPPFSVTPGAYATLADHLVKVQMGGPDYKAFEVAPLPSHLPGPGAPADPLGRTDLGAEPPKPGG